MKPSSVIEVMERRDDDDDVEANRVDEYINEFDTALAELETTTSPWAQCPGEGKRLLGQFEGIFWAGDLNYRLDTTRERADLRVEQAFSESKKNSSQKKTQEKSLRWLLRRDQLLKGRKSEHVFKGYAEGDIAFKPTFVSKMRLHARRIGELKSYQNNHCHLFTS